MEQQNIEYAGFWIRVGAALIDTLLIIVITFPLLFAFYGWSYFDAEHMGFIAGPADFLISWVLPAAATILFWTFRQATPGKMLLSLRIQDANNAASLSLAQSLGRYLGYFVATLPLGLGLIWIAFDPKKQGWHDKLAHTVVVKSAATRAAALQAGPSQSA